MTFILEYQIRACGYGFRACVLRTHPGMTRDHQFHILRRRWRGCGLAAMGERFGGKEQQRCGDNYWTEHSAPQTTVNRALSAAKRERAWPDKS
jgi:hypothetical protein